ncbi:MAG TPA: HEAT repeat domain-containing protein [Polyangiaceae bacterium]
MSEDLYELRDRARRAISRGDLAEAANVLVVAIRQTHVGENEYVALLNSLQHVLEQRGDVRGALTCAWYSAVHSNETLQGVRTLMQNAPPVDRARTLATLGDMNGAANEMETAGLVAAAAIYREKAEDFSGARALWSRLSKTEMTGADAYNGALVSFNLARCAKACGDSRQAREAIVAAVRMLEEAADHFELVGQRERAFDCFQVLVQVGREAGTFEDVLEGFVNCIRILREDHMKYFALQYFDDALRSARDKGELSAAATIASEASDYARTLGMLPTSAHYVVEQGELWKGLARQHTDRGDPPEIAENALLAAILAFGQIGQFQAVGELYRELAQLDLEPARRAHYARASERYANVENERVEAGALPAHLKQDNHFPEVWHVDLIEWEQRGSAVEACADILLDKRWPDPIRRKALVARLTAFAIEDPALDDGGPAVTQARVRLADELSHLQLYAILSPLEALFARPERAVKIAVLAALRTLFFKRSFVTVRAALRDSDQAVVDQAAVAVESLVFQHAFDPLARIVRESPQAKVRISGIRALSKIDTTESAELLLGIVEHGAPADRQAAVDALRNTKGSHFTEIAKTAVTGAPDDTRKALVDVLRARGVQV